MGVAEVAEDGSCWGSALFVNLANIKSSYVAH